MSIDPMRASDVERERIVAELRQAATEGRLDVDELDERTASAYTSKTRGELLQLIEDIPTARVAPPSPSPQRRLPTTPGRTGFTARWLAPARRRQAATELAEFVAPPMRAHGYALEHASDAHMVFARKHRPVWTYVLAVALFPLGLLALLHTEREEIVCDLHEHEDGTLISVSGKAPLAIRRALSELER
ncbi:DUF1707 domain-containing protein [Solirubrobacter sp. CPCC 204708]|uniref:DUF1707 domain-containing protein n=1 Tax=Solirubrobacter deserti TaxID=2282478 RepID=A0ABT4RJF3_9ACTN|nr:DUF1707 domain-containing protein [Solirubrobacter deserti]MBE2319840.1 DUF1707 domain-containing protein [Solirubrobacter deserti]MDA0138679.1 DUF1707 domain-containing protein [Solirubrobacter deserti]